jgi:hypothetical protein
MMDLNISPRLTLDYDLVNCPYCGGGSLHHSVVDVFERGEDEPEHTKVHVDGSNVIISRGKNGNPSLRRDGLSIFFWCESCENHPKLNIYQHKGSTYIQWGNK